MRFFKSNRITNLTDSELISEYKRTGNNEAVEILFDRYAHLVYALCMKYLKNEEESRDAVISIFEKLIVSLKKYEIKNFTNWIHSVAKNYCLSQLQQIKTKMNHETISIDENPEIVIDEPPAYEEEQLKALGFRRLEEAMQLLDKEQKTCIELFYLKKYCYKEITEITGYTFNEVKSYIQNGKRNLKIYLAKDHERLA